MNPADDDKPRVPLLEQWWGGLLIMLLAVGMGMILFLFSLADAAECKLEWNHPPVIENITSWRIYCGLDLLATVTEPTAAVMLPDGPCEIAVIAVDENGNTSTPTRLKISFVTAQQTVDLMAWAALRSYHTEFLPGPRFYRTRIETPP